MLIAVTTGQTGTRRVARVYPEHQHTRQLRFVRNLLSQIVERPAMQLAALRLPSPDPVTDTPQSFEGNPASGALSLVHQSLTDRVVHIVGEAPFLARQSFQPPRAESVWRF